MYTEKVVGSQTTSPWIPLDDNQANFRSTVGVTISAGGSLTYTVEFTLSDVQDPSVTPVVFSTELAARTASASMKLDYPVTAVRLNVTTYGSGTATLGVKQGTSYDGVERNVDTPQTLVLSNIPFLIPPGDGAASGLSFSGSAGAFTLSAAILASTGAALAGCYCYFSANFGGSTRPAGWYWTVFSSDTAGIVYADMYTSGAPRRITSPTPFSENLTGRITSPTNEVTAISGIILPAGSLGKNGSLEMKAHLSGSTGGTKTYRVRDSEASVQLFNYTTTASPVTEIFSELVCFDSHTLKAYHRGWGSVSASSYGATFSTVDTGVSRVLSASMQGSTNVSAPILMSLRLLATFGS